MSNYARGGTKRGQKKVICFLYKYSLNLDGQLTKHSLTEGSIYGYLGFWLIESKKLKLTEERNKLEEKRRDFV